MQEAQQTPQIRNQKQIKSRNSIIKSVKVTNNLNYIFKVARRRKNTPYE